MYMLSPTIMCKTFSKLWKNIKPKEVTVSSNGEKKSSKYSLLVHYTTQKK